jgi:hypothetical protein
MTEEEFFEKMFELAEKFAPKGSILCVEEFPPFPRKFARYKPKP